jgi:hypothetical protein
MEGWIMGDIRTSQFGGIPFGNNAGRPDPSLGQPYFNGEEQRLELYTVAGWNNIVQQAPTVSAIIGQYLETNSSNTVQVIGTNFAEGALAYAIGTNGAEISASSTQYINSVQVNATFSGLSAVNEPYNIKVLNPSNLFGIMPNALFINQTPVWSVGAGSLGSIDLSTAANFSVSATDPEGGLITYSISSGSLPDGLSLNTQTGAITGTAPSVSTSTTYSFSINASDGNNVSTRAFSILVNGPTISGGILASDSTYYYRVFKTSGNLATNFSTSIDLMAIAGGGGGAQVGGGAGGLIVASSKTIAAGTYQVVVGLGGALGLNGGDTTVFGHTANGGGAGAPSNSITGGTGGSGGGAGRDNGNGGTANQSSGTGYTGYGYNGGNSSYTGHGGGGGGGGAGAVGGNGGGNGNASAEAGGSGGAGHNGKASWLSAVASIMPTDWQTATSTGYIGGGGGTASNAGSTSGTSGSGGSGGGGRGFNPAVGGFYGDPGINHTGGGGGSSREGGHGVVIIRYTKASVGG